MTRQLSRMLLANLVALGSIFSGGAMAIEEPAFDVIEKQDAIEIRQYRPFIVAETVVEGALDQASSEGFRLIADYIFGNNRSVEKIAMTAPVTVEPAPQSEKIAMTAPVTVQPEGASASTSMTAQRWRVHFVMPVAYSMATLPRPNNPRVSLREVPGKRYAVLVFSGLAGQGKVQQKSEELMAWLQVRQLAPAGSVQLARYDPPWTLPFFRRNEILIEIPASTPSP